MTDHKDELHRVIRTAVWGCIVALREQTQDFSTSRELYTRRFDEAFADEVANAARNEIESKYIAPKIYDIEQALLQSISEIFRTEADLVRETIGDGEKILNTYSL